MIPKRTVFLTLLSIMLIAIAVRYPLVDHERNQTDSYFIHRLSYSIVDSGYAKWTFSAFSYVGLYPFSYPSGMPFLIAEVSSLTGLNIESCILLTDFVVASVFCLACFVLARQFLRRPEYVLLATLLVTLGPRFVDTSYWGASARGPFVVLFILVVFVSFRAFAMGQNRLFILAGILAFGCFAMHHMAVLLVLFGAGYLLAAFETYYFLERFSLHRRRMAVAFNVVSGLALVVFVVGFSGRFGIPDFTSFERTSLLDINPTALSIILNMAASYTNQIGFILLFALIGIPSLFRGSRFSFESLFPLAVLIVFIPVLGSALYVSMLLAPFVAILGSMWIAKLLASSRRRLAVLSVIVLLIISSAVLPIWSTQRWSEKEYLGGKTVSVDDQVYNDASYLRVDFEGTDAISNIGTTTSELAAIGHVTFLGSGVSMVLSGDVTREDIVRNLTWSADPFPKNLYVWFEYPQQPSVDFFVLGLMITGVSFIAGNHTSQSEYYLNHPKLVVVVDSLRPSEYVDLYSISHANLPTEILRSTTDANRQFSSYECYQSAGLTLYLVQLPF
jgi:hypothetical protein